MEQEYKYMVCTSCMTYNHAPYIVDAMNGFTMQETTFPVYYLITDDASTDGEPDVIKQYLADYFQTPYRTEETDDYHLICATHKTNHNCNFIVFLLKYNHYSIKKPKLPYQAEWRDNAKYIAFCEGDDYWIHPKKLQTQVQALERSPDNVLCHTSIRFFYVYDKRFYESKDKQINSNFITKGLTPECLLKGYRIQTCSVVVKREAQQYVRSHNPFLFSGYFKMGDSQLWYFLSKMGNICYIPQTMCVYRKHAGSATRSSNIKAALRFSLSAQEWRLYISQEDNLDKALIDNCKISYAKSLINYSCFDNDFKPLFPIEKLTIGLQCLMLLKRLHLLKPYLFILFSNKNWLGYLKRTRKKEL